MAGARNRICEAALRLFNEAGYESVSMREIAAEAETTIGNLTYHFSKKEDLVDALLENLHTSFSSQLEMGEDADAVIERLASHFVEAGANRSRYPFYFRNMDAVYRGSSIVREENNQFSLQLFEFYCAAFKALREDGMMHRHVEDAEIEMLSYAMIDMEFSWDLEPAPRRNPLLAKKNIGDALVCLLGLTLTVQAKESLDEAYRRALCATLPANVKGRFQSFVES